jgi:branched-chain amino acid transport system substrate-binding protein
MRMTNRLGAVRGLAATAAALLVGLACGTTQSTSSQAADPGVTSDSIHVGTTVPLSGSASIYAAYGKGQKAYYDYLNAEKGGVNGRKINLTMYDDAYDPAKAVPLTNQLVTQDNVFAVVGQLGTPVNLATRPYLNQQKVPDLFVATGSSHWGSEYKQYPWTIGYQPDYVSEGKIYAKDILANHPNAKIGVLRQNDDYGLDYLNGLTQGLGSKASSMIVDVETYEATAADVSSQVPALKSKGADLFYIAATPKYSIQAIAGAAKLAWKPFIYLNNVSTQVPSIRAAIAASTPDAADLVTSTAYGKDPGDRAKWGNDSGMQLYYSIMAKYCQGCDPTDNTYAAGMSTGWLFAKVVQQAGKDGVTRSNIMKIVRNMHYSDNPLALPGITIQTGGSNQFPVTQEALEHWNTPTGTWNVSSTIINAR